MYRTPSRSKMCKYKSVLHEIVCTIHVCTNRLGALKRVLRVTEARYARGPLSLTETSGALMTLRRLSSATEAPDLLKLLRHRILGRRPNPVELVRLVFQ